MKRGFGTKREAQEWERTFLLQKTADMDMTFEDFVDIYREDMKNRIVVTGSPRTFKALRNQFLDIHNELTRLKEISDASEELLSVIAQIGTTLGGFQNE